MQESKSCALPFGDGRTWKQSAALPVLLLPMWYRTCQTYHISRSRDSNPQPTDYKSVVLPIELNRQNGVDGIRTHVPFQTNGFQDRRVMTASLPLQKRKGGMCLTRLELATSRLKVECSTNTNQRSTLCSPSDFIHRYYVLIIFVITLFFHFSIILLLLSNQYKIVMLHKKALRPFYFYNRFKAFIGFFSSSAYALSIVSIFSFSSVLR